MSGRAGMQPIGSWRAYFAPVDRTSGAVTRFDASAAFDVEAPPTPWTDLGWIRSFERSGAAELESVATGTAGVASLRFRRRCEGGVKFDFCEWGKLQMALAASSQHINLLGDGSYSLQSGTETEIVLTSDALEAFAAGDLVAVDVDFAAQSGFVGTGVSGAFVTQPSQLGPDFIRSTTFNVARVKEKSPTALVLEQPLLGGVPSDGAKVQKVLGFADREGASFLQEWSALFVMNEVSGGRVVLWYPRLQTAAESGETLAAIDGGLAQAALHAKFAALPIADEFDGEYIVSYRYYLPAKDAPAY